MEWSEAWEAHGTLDELRSALFAKSRGMVGDAKPDAVDAVLRLRRQARQWAEEMRRRRLQTTCCRDQMERAHLTLHNTCHEEMHLARELDKCRRLETVYQTIPLDPVEVFEEQAPVEWQVRVINDHERMLKRLEFERLQRQTWLQKVHEAKQARDGLIGELRRQKDTIDKMDHQLDLLVKMSRSLQMAVGYPIVSPVPDATLTLVGTQSSSPSRAQSPGLRLVEMGGVDPSSATLPSSQSSRAMQMEEEDELEEGMVQEETSEPEDGLME